MKRTKITIRILVTGFGPFPHVRVNPTQAIIKRLVQQRGFDHIGLAIIPHIFPTRWSILDAEVEKVITHSDADAVLHLGVAARRKHISIETVARTGSRRMLPDASGVSQAAMPAGHIEPQHYKIAASAEQIHAAIGHETSAVRISNNAGRYLCNGIYAKSLALRATKQEKRPTVFIHVPMLAPLSGTIPKTRIRTKPLTLDVMTRAMRATIRVLAKQVR
ncbi:MAG: hypothetical protein ACRCTD_04600 [Beijerinckiaceae bacterium]